MHRRESAKEHTLLHHSACKIISHILVNCNGSYQNLDSYNQSEHRVKGIDDLDLPQHLKELLHGYVGPIHEELRLWYNQTHGYIHPEKVRPVFTWRGTLDMAGTARKLVDDERQNILARFTVACTYGFESDIHRLEGRLTRTNVKTLRESSYSGFVSAKSWLAHLDKVPICEGGCLRNLEERELHKITQMALYHNNDVAFRYLEVTRRQKAKTLLLEYFVNFKEKPFHVFRPISYYRLFKKLSSNKQKKHLNLYSYNLLMALLKWPYQVRFRKVSQSLVDNLDGIQYKRVWNEILCNVDTKNYDYVPLLHFFFKLGVDRKHPFFHNPTPDDQRLINLVRSVLVRHRYPDIIDEVKDDTIVSTLQILDIS